MSRNRARTGTAGRRLLGALVFVAALPLAAQAQQTVYWRSGAGVSNWWDGANPWYRSCDGLWIARPDYNTCYEASTIGANIVRFDNGSDLSMSINGAYFQVHQLMFDSGTGARTMTARDSGGIDMRIGSSTMKIENNDSDAQILNTPVVLYGTTQINPVSGNLTFNQTLYLKSNWIEVYGSNQKYLYLYGQLNADGGNGGLAVKQDSIVVVTNNNTMAGAIWVEKGTVQLNGSTNAIGAAGVVNVGTNATLDLAYTATVSLRPATLNLYGTGTNAAWGALRKSVSGATTWRGIVSNWTDARIVATSGNIHFYNNIVIGAANTLYVTNVNAMNMTGGEMTGGKQAGDGALFKTGAGAFLLRPGAGLTGSVWLAQGEMRQGTGNSSVLAAGGVLVLSNNTTYRTDDTTAREVAKAVRVAGNVTLGYSGGGLLTISGNVDLNAAQRALSAANDVTITGAVTNGGLTKTGTGTLILRGANTYAAGTLISAGLLQIGSNGTAGSVSGSITNNSALAFYRTDAHTHAGVISGTGVLTNRAGTLTLSGHSPYTGNTTAGGGTLLVSGSLSNSAVTVASGATLAGAGTIGTLAGMSGGTVSPGNTAGVAGTLSVTGAVALGGGTYTCDITGLTSTDCDKIAAGGAVAAAAALTINLPASAPGGFSESTSYSWTILSGSSASAANMSIGTEWAASGDFDVSAVGNTIVVTYTAPAPDTPTGLAASDGTSTAHVALTWADGAGETGYVVWRHTANVFASSSAIYTNAANTTNYNDTGASVGTLYYYWVTATNPSGSSAESTSDSGYKRLAVPTDVAATDGSSTANVTVEWTGAAGASAHHVFRDTDSGPAGASALGAQATPYADTSATPGQLYYFWVMASNSTTGGTSDWSTADSGYRKLATVADVAATENLSDMVTVTWSDITGETGYNIWRHTADVSGSASIVGTAVADATSYDDTTATPDQDYYYWVRGTNSTSASMGDFSSSDYGYRILAEPSAPASNIVFSALAPDSYTVGWTRAVPPGGYVLVVAKQGSAPTDPSDSTVYTANAAFGSGDQTAAGSYVVYKGTGTSVPVTGLSPETEYYFAVYEFNGDATPNYRTSDEPVSNRYTLATEPATQASGLSISSPAGLSMSGFTWTDGNGASRILVAKAGSAVDSLPVDGTSYSYSTNFGSGSQIGTGNYVVWIGAGQPARISDLSYDVVYHFRLFEFNGSATTVNYNTNSAAGNPLSQTTIAVNPGSIVSNLAITAIGTDQFTITWTKGITGTNTLVVVKALTLPSDPTDMTSYTADPVFGDGDDLGSGSYVVYNGTGESVTVTGLTPGTLYKVEASAFNGSGGSENYRASPPDTEASTLMLEPATQATAITFGTLGETSYAVSYTAGNGLSRLVVAKAGSAVDWLPADGTAYSGEDNNIGSATNLGAGNFLVHRGASPFTLSGLSAQTEYHIRIFEYQGTNATLNYNTNAAAQNPSNRFTLSTEPTAHGTLAATALSDTQVRLEWGAATGEGGFVIVRKSGSAPTGVPADGTAYSQGTALSDGTVVYVTAVAGAGSVTDSYSTAAGTAYHYVIYPFAYNGTPANATYNYYTGGTPGSANATTGPAEPATSSTLVSFLPASGSSATISWTNTGSADGTIILVKSVSAVNSNPADWTKYTADTVFGAGGTGDELGTGNYVVVAEAGSHGTETITGLSAGTTYHAAVYPYNGSDAFLNYRTTSPATGSATILPDPTAQSATADGKTLVDLAWTKNASYDVMIVYKSGSAPTVPTQGQAYNAGDACGGGTVIYKGDGAALEHVVASGTAHYYAFYSYSSSYYSAGVTASTSTTAFAADEIVETFSYTNSTALTGCNGSNGWGGAWYGDTALYTNSSGSFATQTNYPANTGNKLWVYPPDNTGKSVHRWLGQDYKSGQLYFGYILNYTWNGPGKWSGLAFCYSNNEEKIFFGEIGNEDQYLGITNVASSYQLLAGGGNDYIIVGCYDWAEGKAYVKAYKVGTQAVPVDEPTGAWDLTNSMSSNSVGWVNTIRLTAGASSGTPGNTYFDEVRIATNWSDLIGVLPSKPLDPTGQTAVEDGSEMARLAWATNAEGNGVMIVHKTTAITTDPTDGVSYNAGDTVNGGTVIYKGATNRLEHVVSPGTTNFYKFYSYSGANYYSTGVTASVTNDAYADYEKVNPFSYTNGTTLGATTVGGQGFGANYWAADLGTWTVQTNTIPAVDNSVPKFLDLENYPPMAGNLVYCSDPGNGSTAKVQRTLSSAINSGKFYIAFQMAYQYRGANKWAGVSLLNSGGTEKAFLGKGGGGNWSTLGIADGSSTYWSAFDLGQFDTAESAGNTGNVYIVVGKYDFDTDMFQASAYRILDTAEFPDTEPTSWDVSQTMAGIDNIARFQLNVGSSDPANTIGKVFFDEIRHATNWSQLLAVTCPTWAGSNTINGAAWGAATNVWLGNTENFQFQSSPAGPGQTAAIEVDWAQDGGFATSYSMDWWQTVNNTNYWTNQVQLTAAGVYTSRFAATGSGCGPARTNNSALNVQNLNPPTGVTAAPDGVNTNSEIDLGWTRGDSGGAKDTLIVRQTSDAGWTAPVNGTTYNAGDALGSGTVVYRGAGTNYDNGGLAPNTTYYYRFYAENWTYYSTNVVATNATTAPGSQTIIIDGDPADWTGSASPVINSSASSVQQFIWTDKRGDVRPDKAEHPNADIEEFRVFADDTWVYFLVKLTNIIAEAQPFVAVGVDTRTNAASTALNWLGDDSGLTIGGGYFAGASEHYPEYQLNAHYVAAASGSRIELYRQDGSYWEAPGGGNTNVVISAPNDAVELKVLRSDLNLTGEKTARFTVAAFLNTGAWNNDGDGTLQINTDGSADAADTVAIPYWTLTDNALERTAWQEDISDAKADFWLDVKFGAAGLTDNQRPSTPAPLTPTNAASTLANPALYWNKSTDNDGQITGYLLEVSTNDQFNGVSGSENGAVALRVNLDANTTNYTLSTSATQYWWRVRARDTAGELSLATTRYFRVVGKLDLDGPVPTLVYIGTNVQGYLNNEYNERIARYGYIQNVTDNEIQDTNNVFGFVIRWDDASGTYATNKARSTDSPPMGAGGFAWNIVSSDGRVSPNWDLFESNTVTHATREWGYDEVFHASNTLATGNSDSIMTNYVRSAFTVTNYDPDLLYYLTLSAEDSYQQGGSWMTFGTWNSYAAATQLTYSGWCEDGPYSARNVTTNTLIPIQVTDDDIRAPVAATNLGLNNGGTNATLVVSNATARLTYVAGEGQDTMYEATDGNLVGSTLWFNFNAYDAYYKGVAVGTGLTFEANGRTLTNTAFVVAGWQTNRADFNAAASDTSDTTDANTLLTWQFASLTTNDVTALWGAADPAGTFSGTNLVQLDLYDVDNDRDNDQASDLVTFGRLRIADDDADDPDVDAGSLAVTGTGLASEYKLANLVEWSFTGTGGSRLDATNAIVATNIVSGNFTNDTGAITGTDIITVSAGFSGGSDRSWLFTLAPVTTDKTFKAISLSFDSRVSSVNGPDRMEVYGTLPGGEESLWATLDIDLSDPDHPEGTNWNAYSAAVAMPASSTGTVTFRIKAYVADTNHLTSTSGNATWSVDNLIASGYVFGQEGGTQVTDRDLAQGTARFEADLVDTNSGLYAATNSGRAPRVDFWHTAGVPVTNAFFTNGLASNGAARTATKVWGYAPAANRQQIQGGSAPTNYMTRFTAEDFDEDREDDSRTDIETLAVDVYDNDTNAPVRGFKYGGPLGVFVDGAVTKAVASGYNREYRINDEQLQTAASTSITVKVNLYDFSGWTVPTLSVSNTVAGLMSTNSWLESLLTDTVDTTNNPEAEMVWTLAKSQADTLFGSYESVTNEFRVSAVTDKDDDRRDGSDNNIDNLSTNYRIGYLTFIDNDVGLPNVQSNWSVSRGEWRVPQVFLGLPGDAARSNLYLSGLPASTNDGTVLANLTNRIYDSQLAQVSVAAPLSFVLPIFDTGGGGQGRTIKGVRRATALTEASTNGGAHTVTNTSLNIGTVRVDNVSAYQADMSSSLALTKIAAQFPTSVWAFTAFSYAEVGQWLPGADATASNHVMSANLYDADDNRSGDQRSRDVALGTLQVLDNDTVKPSLPTNLKVNGTAYSGPLDRYTAAWTNDPEFRLSFAPSADGEPAGTDLEKTGIAEHRTATSESGIGPDLGTPLAVPAEGALANAGFEQGAAGWTLSGAEISTEQAYEGTNSVKMTGSSARQTVRLFNTNSCTPRVTVTAAQFMGAAVTGVLTVAGLDANASTVTAYNVEIIGTTGVWVAGSSNATELATTVEFIEVTLTSGTGTYWDDIRLKVELLDGGTPLDEINALFTAVQQGLTTNYLFAVDRDNNRAGDRKVSSAPGDPDIPVFGIAYDITRPAKVPGLAASTDDVDDPTTQFDLEWNAGNVGPDDPDDPHHPGGPSTDLYSPWHSYKIYYGVFNPAEVPGDDDGWGDPDAFIYTNFVLTGAYTNWLSVAATNTINDPQGAGTNYLALTNLSQAAIRLYDLDYDQEYAVIVVGLDRAGNEGQAGVQSWATNNTIKFAVTQGVMVGRATVEAAFTSHNMQTNDKGAAGLFWIAAGPTNAGGQEVSRDYDLIYWDDTSFDESSNILWTKVDTVRSNWFVDAAALSKTRGNLRFYRASYKDRWQRTNVVTGVKQRPLASEEVYALHNVIISEGFNYVGLHGQPYTNTFRGVFGTDTNFWPASATPAQATRIGFYTPSTNAALGESYFLGLDGGVPYWFQVGGGQSNVTDVLQEPGFFMRGFSIILPTNLTGRGYATTNAWDDSRTNVPIPAMVWHPVLRVPATNGPGANGGFSQVIHTGYRQGRTNVVNVFNLVSLNLPVAATPGELQLVESGFAKGAQGQGDEIYTIDTTRKAQREDTTLYCDDSGNWWCREDGAPANGFLFQPNDMIVIVSRNLGPGGSNTWTWTYHPTNFYTLPTRWMGE